MSQLSQITVCQLPLKHHFKDMRAKSKQAGPPWFFFMRCVRCTAILQQVITCSTDTGGNNKPGVKIYLITPMGTTELSQKEAEKIAAAV
jgi:hypothetical protein